MTSGGFFYVIIHTIQELTGLPYWASTVVMFGVIMGMAATLAWSYPVKREKRE